MPTADDYEPLAPFTIDELVGAVNSVLRDRPHLHIQVRTVRYYIAKGLIRPPSGSPKFARYGMEHLRGILDLRAKLNEGSRLMEGAEERKRRPAMNTILRHVSEAAGYRRTVTEPPGLKGVAIQRVTLGPGLVLEVEGTQVQVEHLAAARDAIDSILDRSS